VSPIALVGNLSVDRVAGGAPRPGGLVFHAARAAVGLGADAVVVTRCAPADRELVLEPLLALGLPVTCADASETTAFSFHYEGDRRVMTVDAVGDPWTAADVEGWAGAAVARCDWVLVGGLLRSHLDLAAADALAAGGRRLLLDAQGVTRVAATGPLREDAGFDRALLRDLAVLKLNEQEAEIVAGGLEQERLEALGVPEVVLTLGSRGARVLAGGAVAHVPPSRVDGAVDPTGAGDAFSLVYVDGRARGLDPAAAAGRAAGVVAGLITVA
jgi:sugar/nucleoside kinase (ribokinase family)